MEPIDPGKLAGFEEADLADALLKIAQAAQAAAETQNVLALAAMRDTLREAARRARRPQLRLLELAAAFVESIARSEMGREELAIRGAIADVGEQGLRLLEALMHRRAIAITEIQSDPALNQLAGRLAEAGVFRRVGKDFVLPQRWVALVRDFVEPPAFRLWRAVNEARGLIELMKLPEVAAAAVLEARLGVTNEQASFHLRQFPLTPERPQRVLYERPPTRRTEPVKAESEPVQKIRVVTDVRDENDAPPTASDAPNAPQAGPLFSRAALRQTSLN